MAVIPFIIWQVITTTALRHLSLTAVFSIWKCNIIRPKKFVGNWDTPILVIHGQKDFRIDASQGMAAFNAARMRGIPAQYLYFPEECHWVLGCQDGILWQRTFKAWLDKWLK